MAQARQHGQYHDDWKLIAQQVKAEAGWRCVRCGKQYGPDAGGAYGVHHFDGNRENNARWNLMPLDQACHLSVQARVDPANPIMFDPRPWAMPFISGLYESGRAIVPASYDLPRWVETYEREVGPWPTWAPVAVVGGGACR